MRLTQDSGLRTQDFVAAVIVLASRILTAPISAWESDEMLFASAVRAWDPSRYHPHPPGYPLFVMLGKMVNIVTHDPWRGLLWVSILAAPLGFLALCALFRRITGDDDLSLCGAIILYFSSAMLVHGTLAMSDSVAVAFAIAALLGATRIDRGDDAAILTAVCASFAIGCRPQLLVPLAPVLLYAVVRSRRRVALVVVFTIASLVWFIPLLVVVRGPHALWLYQTNQARYFAAHDASSSRAAYSTASVAIRFLVHPWGSKLITIPVIVLALLGILPAWRRRRALVPLAIFTATYLVFELATLDPNDAARYNLPAMIFAALLVALGAGAIRDLVKWRAMSFAITAVLAVLPILYLRDILVPRHETLSAPAAAAAYIATHFPPNTVILADNASRPDAEYLLPHFRMLPTNTGLRENYDRPDVPLVRWENGGSNDPRAKVFAWPDTDAYGKLTRNAYLRATVDPLPPTERYLPLAGVFDPERDNAGEEWRWLARDASLRLPRAHTSRVVLHLNLPPASVNESLDEQIFVKGAPAAQATLHRGKPASVLVPVPPGDVVIRILASRAYVPDQIVHNGDTRALSAQLTGVAQQ